MRGQLACQHINVDQKKMKVAGGETTVDNLMWKYEIVAE